MTPTDKISHFMKKYGFYFIKTASQKVQASFADALEDIAIESVI